MLDHATRQILDLAISPSFSRDGIGFLATSTGLEGTHDGGAHWARVAWNEQALSNIPVTAMAISHDHTLVIAIPGGVGQSRDFGETWSFAPLPDASMVITAIGLSPSFSQHAVMVVGTAQDGALHSDDGGKSWEAWNSGLLDRSITSVAISSAGTMFAGTDLGVHVSHNGGRRWDLSRLGGKFSAVLALAPIAEDVVLAGTEDAGLWQSWNAGESWARVADTELGGEVSLLAVVPGVTAAVVAGEAGLMLVSLKGDGVVLPMDVPIPAAEVVAMSAVDGEAGEARLIVVDRDARLHGFDLANLT